MKDPTEAELLDVFNMDGFPDVSLVEVQRVTGEPEVKAAWLLMHARRVLKRATELEVLAYLRGEVFTDDNGDRHALVHEFEAIDGEDIAELTGVTREAVRKQLHGAATAFAKASWRLMPAEKRKPVKLTFEDTKGNYSTAAE